MAHARLKEGRKKLLIPIMMEDITKEKNLDPTLELYVKAYHYIKVTNNMELLRKKLVYAMPRKPLRELLAAEAAVGEPDNNHIQVDVNQIDQNQAGPSNDARSTIHGLDSEKVLGRLTKKGYPGDKMRARMVKRYKPREDNFKKGKAKRKAAAAAQEQHLSDVSDESNREGDSAPSDEEVYTQRSPEGAQQNNVTRDTAVVHMPTERTPLLL